MATWKVKNIISGNVISLQTNWKWKDNIGNEVSINGYKLEMDGKPAQFVDILAKQRLEDLLTNKDVSLGNVTEVEIPNQRIKCSVFLDGVNIADYFTGFGK